MLMSPLLSLQALADWCAEGAAGVRQLIGLLHNNGLLDNDTQAHGQALTDHLAAARLVLDLPAADAQPPSHAALADSLRQLQRSLWSEHVQQHCDTLRVQVGHSLGHLQAAAIRHLADRRHQTAGQLDNLQQLRRRSASRLHQLTLQLDTEAANVARCARHLAALRALVLRQLPALLSGLSGLSGDTVATALQRMRNHRSASLFQRAASRAFDQLGQTLHDQLGAAATALQACDGLLQTSQQPVNAEFGTQLACPPSPALGPARGKLDRILQSRQRHVGQQLAAELAQLRRVLALGPAAAGPTEASASAAAPGGRQEADTVAAMHPDTQRKGPLQSPQHSLQVNPQHRPQTPGAAAQAGDVPGLARQAMLRCTPSAHQCSGVA